MPFNAMSENFVEENPRSAAGENRRADKRIGQRRVQKSLQIRADLLHGSQNLIIFRKLGGIIALKRLQRRKIHAITGLASGCNHDAGKGAAMFHAGAFAGYQSL